MAAEARHGPAPDGTRTRAVLSTAVAAALLAAPACDHMPGKTGAAAGTPDLPASAAPGALKALVWGGQTFLTWPEQGGLKGERYRLYRFDHPPTATEQSAPPEAARVYDLPEETGRAFTDRALAPEGHWVTRYLERWVVNSAAGPVPPGTGLAVVTLHAADLGGKSTGQGWYLVTVAPDGGGEAALATSDAVSEQVAPPQAVRVFTSADRLGHIYVQYMDLRRWNPTFHAPRASNGYLGLAPSDPGVTSAAVYAYTYGVSEPDPKNCEGGVPARLPAFLNLHGWGGGTARPVPAATEYFCALQITPTDVGETWYFGFARDHDYRRGGALADNDVIVNYTEQRLLRMVADLMHDPVLGPRVDPERIYAWGHSMGGGGALALASRYPQVFAAAYASQPMTDPAHGGQWLEDMAPKWGTPAQKLPIALDAPEGWAAPLGRYAGQPVYEWQSHPLQLKQRAADDSAPFGVSHGRSDDVIAWATQGQPAYALLDAGRRTWAAEMGDGGHSWAAFRGLPPPLASDRSLAPFQAFRVVKNETLPGFSRASVNSPLPPPNAPGPLPQYNARLDWSSSWRPWGELPLDTAERWCMSLRTTDGATARVDVTPRRTRHFRPAAGSAWRVVSPGTPPATVSPDSDGLVTARQVVVTGMGVRLCLERS